MKKLMRLILISITATAIACQGCSRKPAPGEKILAKVSDNYITLSEFQSKIAKLPVYYRNIVERDKKRYLEDMVIERLFYEDAVRKGVDRDVEVKEVLRDAKKRIVMAKFVKIEVDDKIAVTDDEIRKYYDAHKEEFKTPELWRASHILVATDKEARVVVDALSKGSKFEDLAAKLSMDATASRGGDVGYFRRGQLVPDFEKACLALDIGQTSDVLHTQFGYHIIKLTDKKEPGIEDFEKVKARIESEIKKGKRKELFDKLVMDLKNKYGVVVDEEAFKAVEQAQEKAPSGNK